MATIRKRGNSYQIRVSCGYNAKGEQVVKTKTYKPTPGMTEKQIEKEVTKQAALFEERCQNGLHIDGNIKLSEFMELWFKDYAEKQLKTKTVRNYSELSKRINQALGHIRLTKLQPHHIIEFYDQLQTKNIRLDTKYKAVKDIKFLLKEKGYTQSEFCKTANIGQETLRTAMKGGCIAEKSANKIQAALEDDSVFTSVYRSETLSAKTIQNYHRFLSSMLSTAVKWQILLNNPCDRVKPPRVKRKEALYMDEHQAQDLLSKLEKEPLQFKTLITLLLFSGMRRSEAMGMEWTDIDFENSIIHIQKSSLYTPEKGIFDDTTKNETSARVIKVPENCIKLLKQHKTEQQKMQLLSGDQWQPSSKVFTQKNGKPMHPDTATAWFSKFLKRNNLPQIHLHSLRHTNASLLIASGTNIRTVAKRLGHATPATTANIYSHAIQTADELASEKLNDILKIK